MNISQAIGECHFTKSSRPLQLLAGGSAGTSVINHVVVRREPEFPLLRLHHSADREGGTKSVQAEWKRCGQMVHRILHESSVRARLLRISENDTVKRSRTSENAVRRSPAGLPRE